ncbi:hypothetical protein SPIRO4BDMA_40803 [uncultured spirochete]|uniref:Uncharacterized protein n=1 Tax=uncultured spirochete TaxID=156406 RepID=A0A3P3XPL2_9SPIR|nr:hypothetical protein SPIRO4BDMA_40803 [uncultured spirochete]
MPFSMETHYCIKNKFNIKWKI